MLYFQAGWKESHTVFISELKNLEATGLTNLGSSLKHTFDLLNVNRMQTGIDTYGQVRPDYSKLIFKFDLDLLDWEITVP